MRINVPIRVDTEAEYELTGAEITAALIDLSREQPSGWHHAAGLINAAIKVLRAVPDDIIAGLNDAPRDLIHKALIEQVIRYEPKATP